MGSLRILVVDDHEAVRRGIRAVLSARSDWFICGEASDGQEAVEKARELRPDVVLMDISMSRLDGIEATRIIRRDVPQSEVIIVSQNDPAVARRLAEESGALSYIAKSDVSRDLVPTLDRLVGHRNSKNDSEHRLRLAMVAGKLGAWELDLGGMELTTSSQCKLNFGRTANEPFTYDSFHGSIHPQDRERVTASVNRSIAQGSDYACEYRCVWPDGSVHWINARGAVLANEQGQVTRMVGVTQDVTERKEIDGERQKFVALADRCTEFIGMCDLEGKPFYCNDAALRLVGIDSLEQLRSVQVPDFFFPEDRAFILNEFFPKVLLDGGAEVEIRFRHFKTGGAIWMIYNVFVLKDNEGAPVALATFSQNITQRKQAEERELQFMAQSVAATAKFRAVFDQSAIFAGIMSLDGTVIEVNRLALDACGYNAEEVLGRLFWETPWWRFNKDVQEKIRFATLQAAQGYPYQEELPYHLADGTERSVDFGLHPIRDDQGKVIFLYPTGSDITERKLAEENFRRLTERLEDEVRVRTSELEERNADILRQSELLRNFSQRLMEIQEMERRRIARELHDSAGQLLSVLSMDLSAIARQAKAISPQLARKAEDSQALVQQLLQEIRTMSYLLHPPLLEESGLSAALGWYVQGLADRSGAEITLSIPEDFARLPRELELVVFRLVQECLTNVYRHSGSKTAEIRISAAAKTLLLEVQDQGRGIPVEKLSRIQSQGSGVGMQGMRERVRQFHGEMKIDSSSSGTTISFTFPIPTTVEEREKMKPLRAAG